jgi:hypothetical protein
MKGTRRIAARISSALSAINVVRDGAEPKTKREGSADLTDGSIPSRASIDGVSCNLRPILHGAITNTRCCVRPHEPLPFLLKDANIAIRRLHCVLFRLGHAQFACLRGSRIIVASTQCADNPATSAR